MAHNFTVNCLFLFYSFSYSSFHREPISRSLENWVVQASKIQKNFLLFATPIRVILHHKHLNKITYIKYVFLIVNTHTTTNNPCPKYKIKQTT